MSIPPPVQLPLPFDGPSKVCARCRTAKPYSEYGIDRKRKDLHNPYCKSCQAEVAAISRAKNREHRAAYNAEYKRAHRTEGAKWMREYRAKHNARLRPVWRARRAKECAMFPERVREQTRRFMANLRKRDPERVRLQTSINNSRRRARVLSAPGTYTPQEWEQLKAGYDYRCLRCGKQEPEIRLTQDHVIPLALGGSNFITNIQPLCLFCNQSKNARAVDYR